MSLYVNKQHILYSQPVSSSTAWMCLWTTHHYILKKNKKIPSTFVCLCNICFNSVNCLCLVGSDHKIWMIWDYLGTSMAVLTLDSSTCAHASLWVSVLTTTGLQLLILIWYLMLVFESSRISRAVITGLWVTSHPEVFGLCLLLWVTFTVSFVTEW